MMQFILEAESIEGLTVKVTDESGAILEEISSDAFVQTDEGYIVKFRKLNACQMKSKVYFTIYREDVAVSNTLQYSIESYAYAQQNNEDETLVALLEAMMNYGGSAYAYAN